MDNSLELDLIEMCVTINTVFVPLSVYGNLCDEFSCIIIKHAE